MFFIGEMYYRVTYPDREFKFPEIEGFVYIGENLSDEDDQDSWYFQFSNSFAKQGSVLETGSGDRAICIVTVDDIEDMLTLTQLIEELKVAESRRKKQVI